MTIAQAPSTMTKQQAFNLCKDLLYGFSLPEFQRQLKELMNGDKFVAGYLPGREGLALTVQQKVLPKYGYPGTPAGVNMMFDDIWPLMKDSTLKHMKVLLEDKLGMNSETSVDKLMGFFRIDSLPAESLRGSTSSRHLKLFSNVGARRSLMVSKITSELLQQLRAPESQMILQALDADDVSGRIRLALVEQRRVFSKHGVLELDNIFEFMTSDQASKVQLAIVDALKLSHGTHIEKLMNLDMAWTRPEALKLTMELMAGFSTPGFQKELQQFSADDMAGRMKLALTVQKEVLPKFGIPGTSSGVDFMLMTIAPYINDFALLMEGWVMQQMLMEIEGNLEGYRAVKRAASRSKSPAKRKPAPEAAKSKEFVTAGVVQSVSELAEKEALTKDQAFKMLWELLEGYSAEDFQQQLQALDRNRCSVKAQRPTLRSTNYIPGRGKLARTVQSKVLPNYGIPATCEAEKIIQEKLSPFKDDWMLQEMLWAIDIQLAKKTESTVDGLLKFIRKHAADVKVTLTTLEMWRMAKEILEALSSLDFQEQVQEFLSNESSAWDMPGRMTLTLTVLSEVLPKYGIPGTSEGIAIMLEAMVPLMDDEMQRLQLLMLGTISPFMHDWMTLMDAAVLEDLLQIVDKKLEDDEEGMAEWIAVSLNEIDDGDEFEESLDKVSCLHCKKPTSIQVSTAGWMADLAAVRRKRPMSIQVSTAGGMEELAAAEDSNEGIKFKRQITGNSDVSTTCDGSTTYGGQDSPEQPSSPY